MSQLQVTGEAKIRDLQGPLVADSGVISALDGAASQYVRGDGTLADFPTSSGGGSSVSYYLNSSVSQGTIGGVAYRELSKEPIIGAGTDIAISANGYVANYITDVNDPDVVLIPGGNFNCEFYFSVNNNTGNPFFYAELYKYDGTTFTLLGSSVGVPEYITQGTTIAPYYFAIPVATATLALTDRLAIRIYVNVSGRTVTLHTENGHLCQVVTTLSKGMVSLNNLTDQSQFLAVGTSGTNFAIVSSGDTHTFNLPVASATNTGKLSSTDWSTFNGKVPYTGANANVDLGVYSLTANKLIAGSASTDNVAIFTTYDEGKAIQLKGSTGDLLFVPFFNPATGARIIAQNTAGSAYTPLSFFASNFYFHSNVNFNSTIGNGTYTYTLPSATGTLALTSQLTSGTVTSVAALTIGTTGTNITSSVANSTTTPVITLNIPNSSATNRGALTAADWITFSNKQDALNGTGFVKAIGTDVFYDNTSYLPLTGGTLTGALSGTSATFSGTISIGTNFAQLLPITALNSQFLTGCFYDGSNVIATAASGSRTIYNSGSIDFRNFTGATIGSSVTDTSRLLIASTGAATFSSSVTATTGLTVGSLGSGSDAVITLATNASGSPRSIYYKASTATINFTQTGGADLMTLTNGGKLLIGTTVDSSAAKLVTEGADGQVISQLRSSSGMLQFYPYFGTYSGPIIQALTGNAASYIPLRIESSTITFNALGTGSVTATSGTLSTVSDMKLKNEDGFIDNALDKVMNLKPRYFYWKEESGLPTDLRQIGFYAQEVNQALGEEAANTPKTDNDNWGIYDRGMIAFLTAAIQELKAELDELKNK